MNIDVEHINPMQYINPENDKYKIINLLFSCDDTNFDLGYILSKNIKKINTDDIQIYFEHELNKKNYINIKNIVRYIGEQTQRYTNKLKNIYVTNEAENFYKSLLKDEYKYLFRDVYLGWDYYKIRFNLSDRSSMVIGYKVNPKNKLLPKFNEYYFEIDDKFTTIEDYMIKNNELQEFLSSINNIDFFLEYYNEKEVELNELNNKINFLYTLEKLINNFYNDYPDYHNKVKKRYFYDKLKSNSFPIIFGHTDKFIRGSYISINSVDKKYKTCNVDIKKWKGSIWNGFMWRRNYKKRNLSLLYNQIKHLIDYE